MIDRIIATRIVNPVRLFFMRQALLSMATELYNRNATSVIPLRLNCYDETIIQSSTNDDLPISAVSMWSHLPTSSHFICYQYVEDFYYTIADKGVILVNNNEEYIILQIKYSRYYYRIPREMIDSPASYLESLIERFRSVITEERSKASNDIQSEMENIRKVVIAREQAKKQGIKYE